MEVLGPDLPLKTPTCKILRDTWLAWRGSRHLPDRADADPAVLKSALSRIALLEVRSRDTVIYRVAGSAFRDTIGFDPTGRNLVDLVPDTLRARPAYRFNEGVGRPCAFRSEQRFSYSTGVTDTFETLGVPLRSDRPEIRGFVLFAIESIEGRRWQNTAGTPAVQSNPQFFEFLDIGAGVPAAIDPPPGYLDRT